MPGSRLDRSDRGVREETGTDTEQNLGTDDTADLTGARASSEPDEETESDRVEDRA